jgi:hypothetical protein
MKKNKIARILNASREAGTVNQTLTNYAVGIAADSASELANFIAPIVATGSQHGQFKVFESNDAFQIYSTARAVGGPNTRIEFGIEDAFFNCRPQGLEIAIDDSERDPGAKPLAIEKAKIRTLVINTNTGHEAKVFDLVKAAKAATGGIGAWSGAGNKDKDIVDEIDGQIQAIINATGMMPNRMVLGIGAWKIIKNHPSVKNRMSDNQKEGATLTQFASMLLNPKIEIRVGILGRNLNKPGKDANKVNIVGDEVFIFIASDNPTQYDPSFAKTFMPDSTPIDSVTEYRDEKCNSDVYKTNWGEDIKVVSTICGRRITVS